MVASPRTIKADFHLVQLHLRQRQKYIVYIRIRVFGEMFII